MQFPPPLPCTELRSETEVGREVAGSTEMLNIPSPIPEVDEALRDDLMLVCVGGLFCIGYPQ